jgi:hypothetical protein
MHPTISYQLTQARIADLRQDAQRDTLAGAARRARPVRRGHAAPMWPALGRRVPAEFESAAARWRSTMCTHEPQCRRGLKAGKAGGQVAGDKFVPEHHHGLDRRLCTRAAPGSHRDRRDR